MPSSGCAYALSHSPSLRGAIGKGEQHMGLPADFVIDRDVIVIAGHWGKVVADRDEYFDQHIRYLGALHAAGHILLTPQSGSFRH
jgi:hypothetical protein